MSERPTTAGKAAPRVIQHALVSQLSSLNPWAPKPWRRRHQRQVGWRLGAEDFLDCLQDSLGLSLSEDHATAARRETLELRAQRLIDEELRKQKRSREDLVSLPKGASLKVKIAERLHRETP